MKESRRRVEAAYRDLCGEEDAGRDLAPAEHLAESSQVSDPVVTYPQLDGLNQEPQEDDLQASPVIPVYSRAKVCQRALISYNFLKYLVK